MESSEIITLLKNALSISFEVFENLANSSFIPQGFDFSSVDNFGLSLMDQAIATANLALISFLKGTSELKFN